MPIEAQMVLALTGGVGPDGQVVLVGTGWTVRPPDPQPMAVYFVVYLPREQAGVHRWRLELTYAEGAPITLREKVSGVPPNLIWENESQIVGLDNKKLTTPLTLGALIALPPLSLPRGREYVWRLTVDDETRDGWALPFRTTPPKALP
jgi:hypothetical protein